MKSSPVKEYGVGDGVGDGVGVGVGVGAPSVLMINF